MTITGQEKGVADDWLNASDLLGTRSEQIQEFWKKCHLCYKRRVFLQFFSYSILKIASDRGEGGGGGAGLPEPLP